MKTFIFLVFTFLSTTIQAESACDVLQDENRMFNIENRQVKRGVHFDQNEKNYIIRYIAGFPGLADDFNLHTFERIVEFYTDEYSYDELSVGIYFDLESGDHFTYVWSYPGDTHVGTWFDESGTEVAVIGDGDFSCLIVN